MPLLSPRERERARLLTGDSIARTMLAYIKPGAPHRYSADRGRLEALIDLALVASTRIDPLLDKAARLREARIGLPELGLGDHVNRATREFFAWSERTERLAPAILLYTGLTLVAATIKDEPLPEAQRMLLYLSPEDSAGLLEALRVADEKAYGTASGSGLSPRRVRDRGISLGDLMGLLEEAGLREYGFLKEARTIQECSKTVHRGVEEGKGLNNSIVRGFLLLASNDAQNPLRREVQRALEEGGMETPTSGRRLFELDKKAREEGVDLSYLLPPLTSCVLAAMLRGAKPP